jgi:hypothetical protein
MEEADNLVKSLTPLERKILPLLKENNDINSLQSSSKLSETEITRALQWLENKKLIAVSKAEKKILDFDENGKNYLKDSLPERRFLNSLSQNSLRLNEIKDRACLDDNELRISLGLLKRKDAIEIKDKVSLTQNGRRLLKETFPEEELLKKLPLELNKLTEKERLVFFELKKEKR